MDDENLVKRLENTEKSLLALWALMQDITPPAYAEDINSMMEEYFNINNSLGADFNKNSGWSI